MSTIDTQNSINQYYTLQNNTQTTSTQEQQKVHHHHHHKTQNTDSVEFSQEGLQAAGASSDDNGDGNSILDSLVKAGTISEDQENSIKSAFEASRNSAPPKPPEESDTSNTTDTSTTSKTNKTITIPVSLLTNLLTANNQVIDFYKSQTTPSASSSDSSNASDLLSSLLNNSTTNSSTTDSSYLDLTDELLSDGVANN